MESIVETIKLSFDQYQRYRMVADLINNERSKPVMNILDIGSGPVDISELLPDDKITRLDTESGNETGYICGSALDMPFRSGSFDMVISCDMFEHIRPDERETFLNELDRVSGEMFIIACPFSGPEIEEAEALVNSFHKDLFGDEHKWLVQHRENGLPSLERLRTWISSKSYGAEVLQNGSLDSWLPMMFLGTYLGKHNEWEIYFRLNSIYVRDIYSGDNYSPSYRNMIVVKKDRAEIKDTHTSGDTHEKKDLSRLILTALYEKIRDDAEKLFNVIHINDGKEAIEKLVRSIASSELLLRHFSEKVESFIKGTRSGDDGLGRKLLEFIEPFRRIPYDLLDELSARYRNGDVSSDTMTNILCLYVEAKPDSRKGWNNLGVVLSERGNTVEAKYSFFNACLLEHPAAYRNLWHLYMTLNDTDSAKKVMNEGLRKGLDTVLFDDLSLVNTASFGREPGLLLERVQKSNDIINSLQMEKEQLSITLEKYRRFAMIAEKMIEERDARIASSKTVILENEQKQKLIAEMTRELSDALPAIRNLAEHLGREDNVTGLMVKLGEICFNFGSNENAKYFFEKAVSMDSRNGDALNDLGVLHFQQGDYETAKDFFVKALDVNPVNKEARINLGQVRELIPSNRCKFCGSTQMRKIYTVRGQYNGTYDIGKCEQCSVTFLMGNHEHLHEDIIRNSDVRNMAAGLRERTGNREMADLYAAYEEDSRDSFIHYHDIVRGLKHSGRILDVGCGNGYFLSFFDKGSWERWGVDYNKENYKKMIEKNGVTPFCGSFDNFETDNVFDVITMLEYIEHASDPCRDLSKAYSLLGNKGVLLIATGNVDSEEARKNGEKWPYFTAAPDHKFFFSHESLSSILKKAGFKEIALLTRRSDEKLIVTARKLHDR